LFCFVFVRICAHFMLTTHLKKNISQRQTFRYAPDVLLWPWPFHSLSEFIKNLVFSMTHIYGHYLVVMTQPKHYMFMKYLNVSFESTNWTM
jgi:hypothetical protein